MEVELVYKEKESVIKISGILNLHSLKDFSKKINDFDFDGIHKIILDLNELEHIDSSGVSGIIQLQKILMENDIFLKIGETSNRVHRLFDQMHLYEIIPRQVELE
jgi:anti-anti-sigma factor